MDGPIGRKRRAKALGSKKEIILSRSLGAGSSNGRIFSVTREIAEGPTKSVPIRYTDQDRQRDEDILDRFDRDFGLDCKPINVIGTEASEKDQKCEWTVKEKRQLDDELIDQRSTSNINLSKISSSGINVSAHDISSPARRRIKNTIQCLSFERYLASIDSKFPPMNEQDRILFWKCCPEPNDAKSNPENTTDELEPSESIITVLENNNEKMCFSNKYCENSKYSNIKNKLIKFNTNSNDRLPLLPDGQNINSTESKENFSTPETYTRREPLRRVYGNARQVKQQCNKKETSELITFKVPENPDNLSHIVKSASNTVEMTATQKEEFYKYLGLETASPNKQTERTNVKKNYKRRSLRVRQLQILQETKRRAKKIKNADHVIKKEETENTVDRPHNVAAGRPLHKQVIDEIANNRTLNGAHLQYALESTCCKQRRSCGSTVECKTYDSPKTISSKKFEIIERIDYSKRKELGNDSNITPCNLQKETVHSFELKPTDHAVNDDKPKANIAAKYNTRMRRKNGFIIKELDTENIVKLKNSSDQVTTSLNNNSSDLSTFDKVDTRASQTIDIIEVGRKCQEKHKLEKIPALISCVESIAYVKPKMSNIQMLDQSTNNMEKSVNQFPISSQPITLSDTDDEYTEKVSLQSDFNGFEMDSIDMLLLSSERSESNGDNNKKEQVDDNESGTRTSSCKHIIDDKTKTESTLKSITEYTPCVPRKQSNSFEKAAAINSTKTSFEEASNIVINLNGPLKSRRKSFERSCTNSIEPMEVETPTPLCQSMSKPISKAYKKQTRKPVLRRRRIIKLRASRHHKFKPKFKSEKPPSLKVTSSTYGFSMSAPDSIEKMAIMNVETVAEPVYSAYLNPEIIEETPNIHVEGFANGAFLPNPLEKSNGVVLHGFYEQDFLIIIQTQKVSFWKYVKILKMLGVAQEWELLGEHERLCTDFEIASPYKNRLCMNELNPVYIEMRAKQFPDDTYRECNLASAYVNVYYYDEWKATVVVHSVHLDTVRCAYTDIIYTAIINSRYFIMCWKQESFTNMIRTGICKYALTPSLNMLASIREFKTRRHTVCKLQCLSDDRLIGLGETRVTIWEHATGDILVDFDFGTVVSYTLETLYCAEGFQEYLFLYQHETNATSDHSKLVVSAVRLKDRPLEFKNVFQHELPSSFSSIQSSLAINNMIIVTSQDSSQLLLHVEEPHKLFFSSILQKYHANRFYTTGSQYFVQVSDQFLIVKTIPELLLDFM